MQGIPANHRETIWQRWELYPEFQKTIILREFRHRRPENYYNKELLIEFLIEKFTSRGSTGR